jgi:hypothetical protein
VNGRNLGLVASVLLSCGHTIYGQLALDAGASVPCGMCAGCGPEFYVCVGRPRAGLVFTYEVRRRTRAGRVQVVTWCASERHARMRAAEFEAEHDRQIARCVAYVREHPGCQAWEIDRDCGAIAYSAFRTGFVGRGSTGMAHGITHRYDSGKGAHGFYPAGSGINAEGDYA